MVEAMRCWEQTASAAVVLMAMAGTAAAAPVAPASAPRTAPSVASTVTRWVSASNANVRTGPSTGYRVLGTVPRGTWVQGVQSGGWVKITSASYAGAYIASSILTAAAVRVTRYVLPEDYSVTVRATASTSATVLRYLAWRTALMGTISGDWLRLTGGGYVSTAVLATSTTTRATNGRMPTASLCALPTTVNSSWSGEPGYTPRTVRYLSCPAQQSLLAMDAAYRKDTGQHLLVDLTYRDLAEQRYWYDALGYPAAAVPGTSNGSDQWATDVAGWLSPNRRAPGDLADRHDVGRNSGAREVGRRDPDTSRVQSDWRGRLHTARRGAANVRRDHAPRGRRVCARLK